jgi:hypothetical protein
MSDVCSLAISSRRISARIKKPGYSVVYCMYGSVLSHDKCLYVHHAVTGRTRWHQKCYHSLISSSISLVPSVHASTFFPTDFMIFHVGIINIGRSQWPRGRKHELSSARSNTGIVGSNPTSGMDACVCVYYVFVLSCVQVAALRRADPPSKESIYCVKDQETERAAKAQQRAVEP